MDYKDYKGILVYVEERQGTLQNVSLELLGKARKLAEELSCQVTAVCIAKDASKHSKVLIEYGADKVLEVSDDVFTYYMTEPYTQAIVAAVAQEKPEILLFGATSIGRDLAPRVSARLGTGLTADCTSLDIADGHLMMTRPAFGGNIMATIACPDHRPQCSTVRPGVMTKMERVAGRQGKAEPLALSLKENSCYVEVLSYEKSEVVRKDIQEANILVSGGRGIGAKEHFDMLKELADTIDGQLSASRAAVDAGWAEHDMQVGQTGKTVRPNLYFAMGISGAIQHVAGMEEAELIISINKDREAKIFEVSDLGVVGDVHKIAPLVTEEIKKIMAEKAKM